MRSVSSATWRRGWTTTPRRSGSTGPAAWKSAYRAVAWLWAFRLFEGYVGLAPGLLARARKFLFLHGRHLETYLSTYFSPNTHLTGEALGLVYLAAAFPHWKCAPRWRATGTRILADALGWHVRADGVYFEQASYYHRYTVDIYTHFYLLVRQHRARPGRVPSAPSSKHSSSTSMWITRPDGTTPYLGDDDGGRLVVLDERPPDDFRAALSTGAALFSRPRLQVRGRGTGRGDVLAPGRGGRRGAATLPPSPRARYRGGFRARWLLRHARWVGTGVQLVARRLRCPRSAELRTRPCRRAVDPARAREA